MTKQEAIEQFKDYENSGWSKSITPSSEALGMAIEALEQQDICYCKDCNIRNKDGYCMRQMTLNLITMVEDTDFCSWGERGEK